MWDMLDMDMLGPPETMPPVALPAELAEMTLDECEDGIPLPPIPPGGIGPLLEEPLNCLRRSRHSAAHPHWSRGYYYRVD